MQQPQQYFVSPTTPHSTQKHRLQTFKGVPQIQNKNTKQKPKKPKKKLNE